MATRWFLIAIIAAIAGGGAYYAWQQQQAGQLDIQTAKVERGDVRRLVSTSGTVRALVTVDIGSQLSGNIGAVNVDYSTEVKSGEVLARIEPSSFETRVRQEEAAVAVAKANVDLQQAGIGRADANLHKAELDLGRAKELVIKGATSQAALDTAIAAEQGAIADVAIAKANVENAKATLTQHEATLDSARIDLDRTYIRSPIDGVVIDKIVEVGQTVAASLQAPKLFTIAQDLTHVQIEAQVDEADIGQVTSANPVTFTVDAYPDAKFEGKVEQIRLAPISLAECRDLYRGDRRRQSARAPASRHDRQCRDRHRRASGRLGRAQRGAALSAARARRGSGARRRYDLIDARARRPHHAPARPAESRSQPHVGRGRKDSRRRRIRIHRAPQREPSGRCGPASEDAREQARMRIAKVLRAVLKPEQYKKYEEAQRARPGGPRSGTVWTYDTNGLVQHQVKLGLADANVTEVTDGLKEGDQAVLRAREIAP